MARLFLRLKLSLIRGRLRSGGANRIGVVVGLLFGVPFALGVAGGMVVLSRTSDAAPAAAVILMAVLALVWTLGPPLAFGTDETLDPARLASLPLTRRQMMVGMLAASTVGTGPTMTMLMLLGVLIALAPAGPAAVLILLACALHLAICLLVGRAMTTALAATLRSRRGRDVAGIVVALGTIAITQLPNLLTNVVDLDVGPLEGAGARVASVLGLTPFGIAGRAAAAAAEGAWLTAVGSLAAASGVLALLGWWWLASLRRLTTQPEGRSARATAGSSLFSGGVLAWVPRTRMGATAGKELRYLARDPRHRVALAINLAFAVALTAFGVLGLGSDPRAVLMGGLVGVLVGMNALNIFGVDGAATSLLVLVGGDHKADLAGKNLALAVLAVPLLLACTVVIAIASGGWAYVPVALTGGVGLLLVSMGIGNVTSVLFPVPQPEPGENPFGANTGQGMANGLMLVLSLGIGGIGYLPIVIAVGILAFNAPGWLVVPALLSPLYGLAVWRGGLEVGARSLARRGPALLHAVQPR